MADSTPLALELPGAKSEQITLLRAAAARCRHLASVSSGPDLADALLAMATDYERRLQALFSSTEEATGES
ncbi:hypothetical protein B5U98_26785 [Bosea sp. Tri-39]|nr:hypothetical protein BLM15_28980 [Bosea sp. Tri-49]RXT16771.1 hypothetical protein B5U98_26785 [Bosea sp. Tri-39]RXT37531.1 hypothetical protein B5U99_12630 [Bosea sp. Tri-54]